MSFKDQTRRFFEELFAAAVSAVDPRNAVKEFISKDKSHITVVSKRYELSRFENIWVIGFGKAASSMALGIEDVLLDEIAGGMVITKYKHGTALKKIRILEAGHPIPDSAGVDATKALIQILEKAGSKDLVICLISGGGSALLTFPEEGLSLQDKQLVTDLLLKRGATINQLNTVRKSLSKVKGGKLARIAMPATLVSLIVSDVVGDPIDTIASGPTYPSTATAEDAIQILVQKGIWEELNQDVRKWFDRRRRWREPDKTDLAGLENVENIVVANNGRLLNAAEQYAQSQNYSTILLSSYVQGEAREIAKFFGAIAKEIRHSQRPVKPPACVIAGGETTVTVQGRGLGGRNTEMVLAILSDLQGEGDLAFLSAGTDGTDGPTNAAGAIGFADSIARAKSLNIDPHDSLRDNDSYHFFESLGDLLITGPTGTNVMDFQAILIH